MARLKPKISSGVYGYSRQCFGDYVGFNVGWGYFLSGLFTNLALAVMSMSALDYFFPGVFSGGNNIASIIGISILIWVFYFIILSGVKETVSLNLVATIIKILPLLVFIGILFYKLNVQTFVNNYHVLYVDEIGSTKTLIEQVSFGMLFAFWTFIGTESGAVMADRAKNKKIVSKALLIGF